MPPEVLYVPDASALVEIERIVPIDDHAEVFFDISELLEKEQLVICENLLGELSRISGKQQAHLFVKQGKSSSFHIGADYNLVKRVMRDHRLVDSGDRREYCAPFVLAQALELIAQGHHVVVVTEDFRSKPPPLISLAKALDVTGIPRMRTAEFLSDTKIWPKP